jgi:hypothetical protein
MKTFINQVNNNSYELGKVRGEFNAPICAFFTLLFEKIGFNTGLALLFHG